MKWKNRKFIGSLLTVVLIGVGVAQPELIGRLGAEAICEQTSCEA